MYCSNSPRPKEFLAPAVSHSPRQQGDVAGPLWRIQYGREHQKDVELAEVDCDVVTFCH